MTPVHHVRLRPRNNVVLADNPVRRRILVRAVLARGEQYGLLAFSLADNHLHLELACDRGDAGEFTRRLEISLARSLQLPTGFEKPYIEPVKTGTHLRRLFDYILRQDKHHGLGCDPLREASSLPDLLGLRPLGLYQVQLVRRQLPRLTGRDLLDLLGVPHLEAANGPLDLLVEAGLAATALPSLDGSGREIRQAKRAMLEIADRRLPEAGLAELLGGCPRSLRRLRQFPADPQLVGAIRGQLSLITQKTSDLATLQAAFVTRPRG